MFCLKCGKQIPDESVYCLYCGTQLPQLDAAPPLKWDIRPQPVSIHTPSAPSVSAAAMEIEAPCSSPDATLELPSVQPRQCTVCGRELPETSISEVCVTCLNNRSFVAAEMPDALFSTLFSEEQAPGAPDLPQDVSDSAAPPHTCAQPASKADFRLDIDLDNEYPAAYADPAPKQKRVVNSKKLALIVFALSAVLLVIGAAIAIPFLMPASSGASSESAQSNVERKAVSYAHEMLKQACANPESVSFHKDIAAEENNGVWSVTETFDRTSKQGEFTTTTYTAMLRFDSAQSAGYVPLKLRIDDTVMFDHTS